MPSGIMKTRISQAIIMRIREFGESDLLVSFFTPDRGLQKGVAKGARKSRKRFVNCLDICSLVNLEYGERKGGELCFLGSGRLIDAYPGLRQDFGTLSKASYMIELTEILFPAGVGEPKIFDLLRESLDRLAGGKGAELVHLVFEARAMALGGYGIHLEKCSLCGRPYAGEGLAVFKREEGGIACLKCAQPSGMSPPLRPESVRLLRQMLSGDLIEPEDPGIGDGVIREIKSALKMHREYHLGLRPKTAAYLE